jgi:ribosome-binding factor A
MRRGYDRTQRVGDMIQKALAQILIYEADERMRLATITSVVVSRDLSYAKIYVSVLSDDPKQIKEVVAALNANMKSFRYQLVKEVELRIAPELKFVYDESTAHGFRLSNLIDEAVKKSDGKKK